MYHEPLYVLAKASPGCHPTMVSVRDILFAVDAKVKIIDVPEHGNRLRVFTEAADRWRTDTEIVRLPSFPSCAFTRSPAVRRLFASLRLCYWSM